MDPLSSPGVFLSLKSPECHDRRMLSFAQPQSQMPCTLGAVSAGDVERTGPCGSVGNFVKDRAASSEAPTTADTDIVLKEFRARTRESLPSRHPTLQASLYQN